MRPHPTIRKTVKWGGAVVSAALFAMWVASAWTELYWLSPDGTGAGLQAGRIAFGWEVKGSGRGVATGGFAKIRPRELNWRFEWNQTTPGVIAIIPIWAVFTPVLIATRFAWHADAKTRSRILAGVCPGCHYDRTGLAPDAVCPECGSPAPHG